MIIITLAIIVYLACGIIRVIFSPYAGKWNFVKELFFLDRIWKLIKSFWK